MRILAITADILPDRLGGAEGHFVEVAKRIISKTEKFTIIVGENSSINIILKNAKVVSVNYPKVPNLYGLMFIIFAVPKALSEIKKEKYDLIWASQEFPQAQVGAIVKIFTGIPLYITSQNPLLGEQELVGFGGKTVTLLVTFAFRFANTIAAVSNYSANLARKLGAKKVVIIPNGV